MTTGRRKVFIRFLTAVTSNPFSLIGTAMTTAAAVLFVSLFVIVSMGFRGGAYMGIITFLVLPGIFAAGLALIPLGMWLQRRRMLRRGEDPDAQQFPVIDLNKITTRRMFLLVFAATLVNMVILAVATYEGIEVMDSTEFCGKACHSVMDPEYTTYSRSPHSRVKCVECHIGPGANWFVKSKLSGSWQLVAVTLDLHPRPIPTPVHNLRPARETCEQCHWPTKFVGDRLKVITNYGEDEANTPSKSVLVVRVGGRQGAASYGIHWHVDPNVIIRYRSDESREVIDEVELLAPDGKVVRRYVMPRDESDADGEAAVDDDRPWRTMDCVDCHNRPTHIYRLPHNELDRALWEGRIDPTLPFIRREGLRALESPYPSHEAARIGIARAIRGFYTAEYPEREPELRAKIEAAAEQLGEIWCTNVFPEMKIDWGTYPNHIGHQDTPGCFRCHDGEHSSEDGHVIGQDCDTCHAVLAMEEEDPEVLRQLQP